ncbi:alpha/beta fold hydrolase [Streptomyces sp. NPDC012935]|uniref:alpha/beta fold hydrolase n=1 Tax=Streptomyces sp. NPDC012935 TaxID=3364857 RepID=UPI00368D5B8F
MSERFVKAGELELWTESFGDPDDPTALLIVGADAQGIGWPDSLCHGLADNGRHVIRYDHRNTGRSSLVDFDEHPYDFGDLARDAVAVLDGYGVAAAHVVGISMGGIVSQVLALDHADRVLSLTLMSTSSALTGVLAAMAGQPSNFTPPPHHGYLENLARLSAEVEQHPPTTREEVIDVRLRAYVLAAGSSTTETEVADCRRTLAAEFDRAGDPLRPDISPRIFLNSASLGDLAPRLSTLDVPALVVHGVEDPLIPVEHGQALARAIPGAVFVGVQGAGHTCVPPSGIDQWTEAILDISSRV